MVIGMAGPQEMKQITPDELGAETACFDGDISSEEREN